MVQGPSHASHWRSSISEARRLKDPDLPAPKSHAGEIFGWVFFILSIAYLVIQFNPATMQWNMDL